MKKETWIVVANSSQARIFKIDKGHTLKEVKTFQNPEARMHPRDLYADKPGRSFESNTHARHSLEQAVSPKQQEITDFAKEVCDYLENARGNGVFHRLYLAASPSFLGSLRKSLSHPTLQLIEAEIDKDITHLNALEIEEYLAL